jgi:hypothetical protein
MISIAFALELPLLSASTVFHDDPHRPKKVYPGISGVNDCGFSDML